MPQDAQFARIVYSAGNPFPGVGATPAANADMDAHSEDFAVAKVSSDKDVRDGDRYSDLFYSIFFPPADVVI